MIFVQFTFKEGDVTCTHTTSIEDVRLVCEKNKAGLDNSEMWSYFIVDRESNRSIAIDKHAYDVIKAKMDLFTLIELEPVVWCFA